MRPDQKVASSRIALSLNQIAFSVIDVRVTEAWWRNGLGFLPAGGSRHLMRGPVMAAIQGVPGAAVTCWCLLGRNDWSQLEMFQYEAPVSKLMPPSFRPNDIGYTRCGVWVADFDKALARLASLGTTPMSPLVGEPGKRRACVRNPDGVYVELMEDDPLPDQNKQGRQDCPVAIRSVTMSTPDLAQSVEFLKNGLGVPELPIVLHDDTHEAMWGLAGAQCDRRVLGGPTLLVEVVQYSSPVGQPRPADYRVCDQGILNICFGDPVSRHGVKDMLQRSVAAGARPNWRPFHLPMAGCVYVNDKLGFSYEFMWASPGRGHRDYGFVVLPIKQRPEFDNRRIEISATVKGSPQEVFKLVTDCNALTSWSGLGDFAAVSPADQAHAGRGSERTVRTAVGTVREQILDWQPGKSYRYRIIKGSPFAGYQGEVRLSPGSGGTKVNWVLRFRSRVPGLGGLLEYAMNKKLSRAMKGLQQWADQHAIKQ